MRPVNPHRIFRAWEVITRRGGARTEEYEFQQFARSVADAVLRDQPHEFRFKGIFGFGGKIRFQAYEDRFQADYYPEDRTPELDLALHHINSELERI